MLSLLISLALCWLSRFGVISMCECCLPVSRFGCTEREPGGCNCIDWDGVSGIDDDARCNGVPCTPADGNFGDRKISAKLLGSCGGRCY